MAQTIVLRKVIDNKVDPTSASIAHHDFIVGSSATVWAPFQPTSSSSATNEFTIQVPGQNSLWNRKVMMRTTTSLSWNVLVSGSITMTAGATVPAGAIVYIPYRYGVDFGCTSFPFNSLVQTCNTQINGSTINCQASQVMPVIRRVINSNKELRQKLACPTGVVGTSLIANARGGPYDEMSLFSSNDGSSGSPSNTAYSSFQFTDVNGNPLNTNFNATVPSSTGSAVLPSATFFTAVSSGYGAIQTGLNVSPGLAANSSGLLPQFAALTNGSTYMLPVVINSTGSAITYGVNGVLSFNVSLPVYGQLTTTEPLLFPPFTYNDEEVSFTNVQSANIRLTMLAPNDRMARIIRNIECPGKRGDTIQCASFAAAADMVGFSYCVPQIQSTSLSYGNTPNANGSGGQTPFNIQLYANFLSPSLLEPIPETLNYPFLQYYPLVTTNGQITPTSLNALTPNTINDIRINSGTITSNVITLNTCPDMLALYVVMNPDFSTASGQAAAITGTWAGTTGTPSNPSTVSTLAAIYVAANSYVNAPIGSTVTSSSGSWTLLGTGVSSAGYSYMILNTNATSWVAATYAGQPFTITPPSTTRDSTLSYSDILANIVNVSITWNNNASLLQSFLPSELVEMTASNGLPVAHPISLGASNSLYKASVTSDPTAALTLAQNVLYESGSGNSKVSTIGLPLLLAINKDIPTEAGTAAGVSGVYTLQVTITTRLTESAFLQQGTSTNQFQFFVTPIQTQYLQLIRGGTSAVVSAVAAADKMLTAPFAPRRTLQGESAHAHKLTGGYGLQLPHMAGTANHPSKLWKRAAEVAAAIAHHAPTIATAMSSAPAIVHGAQHGYPGMAGLATAYHAAHLNRAARDIAHAATRPLGRGADMEGEGAHGYGAHGYGAHGMGGKRHRHHM
jgi:hypothetical protein